MYCSKNLPSLTLWCSVHLTIKDLNLNLRVREMEKTWVAKLYDMKVKVADNYCLQKAVNLQIDLFQDRERIVKG